MLKNLSETMILLGSLAKKVSRLENPADYYQGRRHGIIGLPDNILLFTRTDTVTLRSSIRDFHHRNVLVIPLKGSGCITVDGKSMALKPGRCGMIKAYQFHHYTEFPTTGIVWLFITFEENTPPPKGSVFTPKDTIFWNDLAELVREYQSSASDSANRLACRLALLLYTLRALRSSKAESLPPSHPQDLMLRVHRLILHDMQRQISISEFAMILGLSASHLRARFREEAGKSLGQFQREMHLQKAAELLVQHRLTVAEAAEACGWESAFAFSRAFRRYWGQSPKQFALFAHANHPRKTSGRRRKLTTK